MGGAAGPHARGIRAPPFFLANTRSRDARVLGDPSATARSDAAPPAVSARH